MSRLERFSKATEAVLLTAVMGSIQLLQKYVEDHANLGTAGKAIAIALFLLFLLVIVQVVQSLVDVLIEKSGWLRAIVMGKDHIEGVWRNVVRTPDSSGSWTGGIVDISVVHGKYRVRGETFDEWGRRVGTFNSSMAEFDEEGSKLKFTYEKTDLMGERMSLAGYSEYQLNTSDRSRKIFDGFYIKRGVAIEYRLRGEMLNRDERKKVLTEEGRSAVVRDYIAREQGREGTAGFAGKLA